MQERPEALLPGRRRRCPWCEMIATARLMFFLPKPGATTNFRPEDLQDLLNKLAELQLTFDSYTRPKATQPIRGSVARGKGYRTEAAG